MLNPALHLDHWSCITLVSFLLLRMHRTYRHSTLEELLTDGKTLFHGSATEGIHHEKRLEISHLLIHDRTPHLTAIAHVAQMHSDLDAAMSCASPAVI